MKTVAIIQARASSSRLPGKVLMELAGKPMLLNIVERTSRAKMINQVVVATSSEVTDNQIEELLNAQGISCFRGSLNNVLDRFFRCATKYHADVIVRITGDNALVDPKLIDEAIEIFLKREVEYIYFKQSLPLGMCIEVFTYSSLKRAFEEASNHECLEHVTPYIRVNTGYFKVLNYAEPAEKDFSHLRFTVDTREDFEFINRIYNSFDSNYFSYDDIIKILEKNPDWISINNKVVQNKISYRGEDK